MKLNLKAVLTAFIVFAFQRSVFAQASSQGVESIVIPITITRETDIHFENSGTRSPGSVTISPIETTISKTGEVSVRSKTAGSYILTGQVGYLYAITLPTSLTINSGGKYVTAEKFTSYPAINGILDTRGMQMLKIGATFNINPNQPENKNDLNTAEVAINYN